MTPHSTALYPGTLMPTVADAKEAADGTMVQMTGKVMTCEFSEFFYIEEADRSAGIKVIGNYAFFLETSLPSWELSEPKTANE